jgi:hypothetical protein
MQEKGKTKKGVKRWKALPAKEKPHWWRLLCFGLCDPAGIKTFSHGLGFQPVGKTNGVI